LAILVIAREMQSQFEWTMHEPVAREVGLEPAAIEVVKYNKSPQDLKERDALIIRFGRELVREHKRITLVNREGDNSFCDMPELGWPSLP